MMTEQKKLSEILEKIVAGIQRQFGVELDSVLMLVHLKNQSDFDALAKAEPAALTGSGKSLTVAAGDNDMMVSVAETEEEVDEGGGVEAEESA